MLRLKLKRLVLAKQISQRSFKMLKDAKSSVIKDDMGHECRIILSVLRYECATIVRCLSNALSLVEEVLFNIWLYNTDFVFQFCSKRMSCAAVMFLC